MDNAFCEIASKSGASFQLQDINASAVSALRSEQVANDIIQLGAITMNIAAPGLLNRVRFEEEELLSAVLFDYALEVAPRTTGDENVIDVSALSDHVNYMRAEFGVVDISPEFITRIRHSAQVQFNLEQLSAAEEPVNQGD